MNIPRKRGREKVRTRSNNSIRSNISVWYSIKKAAATADFLLSAVALLFVYTDAIFDRQKLMRSALLNDVGKTIFSRLKIEQNFLGLRPIFLFRLNYEGKI